MAVGRRGIERRGIEAVPPQERTVRAAGLFPIWFAANIGVLSFVLGAVLASFGLDLLQAASVDLVATIGSFCLVGVVSVAGARSGLPSLTLSRAAFGRVGNFGPAALNWLSILGWEVVGSVVTAWVIVELVGVSTGVHPSRSLDVVALGASVAVSLGIGVAGYETILRFQRAASVGFGILSVPVTALLLARVHWTADLHAKAASPGAALAAGSIIAAGTGVSWLNLAADYSRYVRRDEPASAICAWVTVAASLPVTVLVLAGYLLAGQVHGLAAAPDPVVSLGHVLPRAMSVPFLVFAAGGMAAETDLACYSSGLALLALGVRARRSRTVALDAGVVAAVGLWTVLRSGRFLAGFESFLECLADPIAAWAGVVVIHTALGARVRRWRGEEALPAHYRARRGVDGVGLASWAGATMLGLATTVTPWYRGPLTMGLMGQGGFGWAIAFVAAAAAAVLGCLPPRGLVALRGASARPGGRLQPRQTE